MAITNILSDRSQTFFSILTGFHATPYARTTSAFHNHPFFFCKGLTTKGLGTDYWRYGLILCKENVIAGY